MRLDLFTLDRGDNNHLTEDTRLRLVILQAHLTFPLVLSKPLTPTNTPRTWRREAGRRPFVLWDLSTPSSPTPTQTSSPSDRLYTKTYFTGLIGSRVFYTSDRRVPEFVGVSCDSETRRDTVPLHKWGLFKWSGCRRTPVNLSSNFTRCHTSQSR